MFYDIIWYIQRLETLNRDPKYVQGFEDAKKTILEYVEKKKKRKNVKSAKIAEIVTLLVTLTDGDFAIAGMISR